MTFLTSPTFLLIQAAILVLAILSLLLSFWAARAGSPIIAIFGRWARWFFLATLTAFILWVMGWSGYGFPVLLIVSVLAFFLLETAYNWLAISALSKSELPLFPKFEENERKDEWPSHPRFIHLKGWLRQGGFQKRQSLVSLLGEDVLMRAALYENEDQTTRLHILFFPNMRGQTTISLTFFSNTQQGDCIVTDNIFLPFGGFYPENWSVERKPWTRSPDKLLQRHLARIDAKAQALMPFVTNPLEQINADQRIIEQLNRDLGFLHSPAEVAEKGRLTLAGKGRLWQELWTLSYLGWPLDYS